MKKKIILLPLIMMALASCGGNNPSNSAEPAPSNSTSEKPSESASTKPSESASTKPSESTSSKPSESASTSTVIEQNAVTLTVTSLGLVEKQPYSNGTAEVNGIGIQFIELGNFGDGIQMRTNSKDPENIKKSSLWNTTAFNNGIDSITLNATASKVGFSNADALIFEFANDVEFTDASQVKLSTVKGQTTYDVTPEAKTYKFVRMTINIKFSLYFESIVINPVK